MGVDNAELVPHTSAFFLLPPPLRLCVLALSSLPWVLRAARNASGFGFREAHSLPQLRGP